jgi:hypothetical protein
MKIYLMARYSRRVELQDYARQLEAVGCEITSRWIWGGHDLPRVIGEGEANEYGRRFAEEDWKDLASADCCIAFTEPAGESKGRGRGGRMVEFGLGLAWGKRMIVVGRRENVFFYLPQVEQYTWWPKVVAELNCNWHHDEAVHDCEADRAAAAG